MTVLEMILQLVDRFDREDIIPLIPAITAVNEAASYLYLKLANRNSDLVKERFADTGISQNVYLPSDFNGFCGAPTINSVRLDPLPPDISMIPATATVPVYYDVIGSAVWLYPAPSATVTLIINYWLKPDLLAERDDIPFEGAFDGLICSMAAQLSQHGTAVLASQAFKVEVEQALDLVLFPRKSALPTRRSYCGF